MMSTKPFNCEVTTCAPLQGSPFIGSADTNTATKIPISPNLKTETSGQPEPPHIMFCAPVNHFSTLLNTVNFAVSLLV